MKFKTRNLKFIKVVAINLILIFIIFAGFDLYVFLKYESKGNIINYIQIYRDKNEKKLIENYVYQQDIRNKKNYKRIENEESTLKPIMLFGDSFVYSNRLDKNGTFAHILAEYTNRPIYNQSTPFVKPQHMLFILEQNEFYKTVKIPEYILYIYVPVHVIEMYTKNANSSHDIFYKLQNGKLIRYNKIPFYKKSYFLGYLTTRLSKSNKNIFKLYFKTGEDLYKAVLIQSKKEMCKRWGDDTKFVIIRFFKTQNQLEDKMFEDLKQEGFVVFEIYNYIDTKLQIYQTDKKVRPNELFWKIAVPILIQKTIR